MMNYFSSKKKWMAYLVLLTFVFTCIVPTGTSFAALEDYTQGTAKYTQADAQIPDNGYGGSTENATDGVTISKTIAPTGIENYFDITLQVQAEESIETMMQTQTTDVVIVMDVSNTMNDLMSNGKSRAYNAKTAAKQFANDFYRAFGASGKIGIVAFNRDARVEQSLIVPSGTSGINSKIDNIAISQENHYHTKWTNIEAGLKAASQMLATPSSTAQHKYIILLTDGFPTTYVQSGLIGYTPLNTEINVTNPPVLQADGTYLDGVFYDRRKNLYCWQGNNYSDKAAAKAQAMAESITNNNVNIFSIGIAIQNRSIKDEAEKTGNYLDKDYSLVDCYTPAGGKYVIGDDSPAAYRNWLGNVIAGGPDLDGEGKTRYSDGDNLEDLKAAYSGILTQIEEVNRQAVEDSWIAADPMGANVEFLHFYDKSGNSAETLINAGYTTPEISDDENEASYTDAINWNLMKSKYSSETSGNTTIYTYELKYRVRLKNEVSGFAASTVYNANGTTTLKYKVNNNGTLSDEKFLKFKMPKVKGYLGELEFTKVDSLTNEPLVGAEFTLTHKTDCSVCSGRVKIKPPTKGNNQIPFVAVSDANGLVSFTNIPSGHDYVLTESNVPDNYNDSNLPSYDVSVAYGVVTDNIPDVSGENVITNDRIGTISVEGTKTWVDGSNEDNTRPDAIVLNLYRYALNAENQKVVADELVNTTPEWSKAGDVWTYKFSGLEQYVKHTDGKQYEYTYYVVEESVSGYESAYNDENKLDINNTLLQKYVTVSGTKEWKDGNDNHKGETITLELFRDGRSVATTTTAADWSYSFGELPKYALKNADLAAGEKADGHVFEYQVREQDVPAGYVPAYDVKVDVNGNYTINITNNVRDDKSPTSISGKKIWTDGNGKAVEIELFGNGQYIATTTTAYDYDLKAWTYKFDELPKYKDGQWINYTVKEVPVEGYISAVIPTADGFDIANTPYVENQGQIAVGKVVTAEDGATPPSADTEFEFSLKIKAELDQREFDKTVAKEEAALKEAYDKAVKKRDEAYIALNGSDDGTEKGAVGKFMANAFMTTPSQYQFIMTGDNNDAYYAANTSPSAYVYKLNGEAVEKQEDADTDILASVLDAIKELAKSFSSLYNETSFMHQLAEKAEGTSPSALAFRLSDASELLEAHNAYNAADKLVTDTFNAWDNYNVTTPTAIKVFWTDSDNKVTEIKKDIADLVEGWYHIGFKLLDKEVNSFRVEATTGSAISFKLSETNSNGADATNIIVTENGKEVETISGLFVAERGLTTESAYGFTFNNIYKPEGGNGGGGSTTISRTVEKVWNDNNNPDRPTSITVQLLRNGEVVETVTLSAANGWSYNWPELDAGYTWSVKEVNVAEGYTASVAKSGTTFIITNTYSTPEENIPDENVPTGSVEPGEPLDELEDPEIPLGDAPATGDTNNAAPFMALLLAAIAGLVITRRKFN